MHRGVRPAATDRDPGSELSIAERRYPASSLPDLLGVPVDEVNDDRLYPALDKFRPLKNPLEQHLRQCFGDLFQVGDDLLLHDVWIRIREM